jgi:hypothetical protein
MKPLGNTESTVVFAETLLSIPVSPRSLVEKRIPISEDTNVGTRRPLMLKPLGLIKTKLWAVP